MSPLSGVRCLDLTRLLPGAYCTLLLADLGAEVIKVEAPGTGDPLRHLGPRAGGASAYFGALNRNKRSVTLDLRVAAARPVLEALVARADVVVESYRPGTSRSIGVDARSVLAAHPGVVHCAITGFGQSGPYADSPGHDINYVALSGLLALDHRRLEGQPTADRIAESPPQPSRALLADIGGGAMSAAIGILAALFQRTRTGRGSSIDISMHDGALAWLMFPAAPVLADPESRVSTEPPMARDAACYNVYTTQDGRHIALGALEPKFWARFCQRIGRPDFIVRQFESGEHQAALHAEVAQLFRSRPRDAWMNLFRGTDACLSPVNSVAEALEDPHAALRGTIARHEGVRYVRSPVRIAAGTPLQTIDLPALADAPALGADTDAVLEDAGIDASARAGLREKGIV